MTLPPHLRAIAPDGAHVADPAKRGGRTLADTGYRREFAVPKTVPVMVRDASTADWADIWPFMKQVLAAGDTMCLPNIMMGSDARTLWFGGSDTEAIVAVDPRDKPAVANPDSPIVGRVVGSASMRTARDGHGRHILHAAFVVDPALSGDGVETELAIAVLTRARAAGYRAVEVGPVVAVDATLITALTSLGWVIVGTVPEGFDHPRDGYVGLHWLYRAL